MARPRHLKNVPIIEAIIDFRVRLPVEFDAKEFSSLREDLSDKYTKIEKGRIVGSIKVKDDKPVVEPPKDTGIKGYWFTSRNKKEVAQFRIDGFTFSRLQPYTKWESVLDEAKRLWELYSLKSSPQVVERISARYINRIDIPSKSDLEEYFTASPVLPKKLPQELSQFFTRLVVHEKDLAASIIQTLVQSKKPEHIGVILDINVLKENVKGISDKSIWSTMKRMREFKNRIFFELIKEKTARLFE